MTTPHELLYMQMITNKNGIQEEDSLRSRFDKSKCICGCNALTAAKIVAIIGFIFIIIFIILLLFQLETYFLYNDINNNINNNNNYWIIILFGIEIIEILIGLICTICGISATCGLNEFQSKIFMYYWIIANIIILIDTTILIILYFVCNIYIIICVSLLYVL